MENKMSKPEPQSPQGTTQKPSQKADSQPVKVQAQAISSKPDKSVPVPKYIAFANERIVND